MTSPPASASTADPSSDSPSHTSLTLQRATPPHTARPWALPRTTTQRVEQIAELLEATPCRQRREVMAEQIAGELTASGTPLVEDCDEGDCLITFVWYGVAPNGVCVMLNKVSDPFAPTDTLMDSVSETNLHTLTLRMPADWIGTYLFALLPERLPEPTAPHHAPRAALRALIQAAFTDPTAREHAPNKLSPTPFAIAAGTNAPKRRLHTHPPVETATLSPVRSPVNDAALPLHRWSHPHAKHDSPTLLFCDGEVWREQYPIVPDLNTKIESERLPPVHALFLESGGSQQRQLDYTTTGDTLGELLKQVRDAASLSADTQLIAVGQSLGGLFTAMATTYHPCLVTAGIAQSPSLWWPNEGGFWERTGDWFWTRAVTPMSSPLLLHVGATEWDLQRDVRHAAALLKAQGTLIDYTMVAGGHDAVWWQAVLPDAIEHTVKTISPAV